MEHTEVTLAPSGTELSVRAFGAATAPSVLVLLGAHRARSSPEDDTRLAERLVGAGLRALLVEPGADLTAATVPALLDELGAGWAQLVGIGAAADLAWAAAADCRDRISALVVLDRTGSDPATPVEVATTALVTGPDARAAAYAAGRGVYADYRVVELGPGDDPIAVLATEAILRSSPW